MRICTSLLFNKNLQCALRLIDSGPQILAVGQPLPTFVRQFRACCLDTGVLSRPLTANPETQESPRKVHLQLLVLLVQHSDAVEIQAGLLPQLLHLLRSHPSRRSRGPLTLKQSSRVLSYQGLSASRTSTTHTKICVDCRRPVANVVD